MIIDAILNAFRSLFVKLMNELPTFTLPDMFVETAIIWDKVLTVLGKLSMWIPLGTVATMGILVFSAVAVSVAIRIIRLIIAYIPTMGGSQR
jgi:hypothetical protein